MPRLSPIPPLPARRVAGWPKLRPCLFCDRLRLAQGPEDRLHERCRAQLAHLEAAVAVRMLR